MFDGSQGSTISNGHGLSYAPGKDSRCQCDQFTSRANGGSHRRSIKYVQSSTDVIVFIDILDLALITGIDTYLFHHGIKDDAARRKRSAFDTGRRAWVFCRRQYDMPRNYWTKFAECDHNYRLQHLARCRSYNEIDRSLVLQVLEFCRSPYVKIRR